MAKTVNMIGGIHGKVGNVVYATVKGENIARVYQPVVRNPKTARQNLSRAIFRKAGSLASVFLLGIRAGWQREDATREFQKAVAKMVPLSNGILTGNNPAEIAVNYAALPLALSKNDLGYIMSGNLDLSIENQVKVTLNVPDGMLLDDTGNSIRIGAVVMIYVVDSNEVITAWVPFGQGETTLEEAIDVPAIFSGAKVHVYGFVKQIPASLNGISTTTSPWKYPAKCSATLYVGTGDLA